MSGGGTNLQALIDAQKSGIIRSGKIVTVVSNKSDAYALTRAENAGIDAHFISKKECGSAKDFDIALRDYMQSMQVDIVVLAGFLAILGKDFIDAYRDKIVNIHPSLIPSFCGDGFYGLKVHQAALDYGVKVTGATVHLVNEITDGGRILMQKAVYINEDDTAETLQRRVMEEAEWKILPEAALRSFVLNERKIAMLNIYDELKNNAYPEEVSF